MTLDPFTAWMHMFASERVPCVRRVLKEIYSPYRVYVERKPESSSFMRIRGEDQPVSLWQESAQVSQSMSTKTGDVVCVLPLDEDRAVKWLQNAHAAHIAFQDEVLSFFDKLAFVNYTHVRKFFVSQDPDKLRAVTCTYGFVTNTYRDSVPFDGYIGRRLHHDITQVFFQYARESPCIVLKREWLPSIKQRLNLYQEAT